MPRIAEERETAIKQLRIVLLGLLALAALLMSGGVVSEAAPGGPESAPDAPSSLRLPSVPGELLVKFKPGTSRGTQLNAERAAKSGELGRIPSLDLVLLRTPPGRSVQEMVQVFRKNPAVEFAEPNFIATTFAEPSDTKYSKEQRWYYSLINAPAGWDFTTGSSNIIVAVVDTGVELTHPDLDSKIWVNSGEIAANGLDDDGNGCIDDVNGCNFIIDPADGDSNDDNGHGTFLAGIIGAESDNAQGVTSVAWNSTIMPVKAFDNSGTGTAFDIAQGITYAAANGAQVINLSFGFDFGGGLACPSSDSVGAAIASAHDVHGAVLVAASGNGGGSCVAHPGSDPNTIAVAASDFLYTGDQRASFSNWGPEVDVAAPGVRIFSTDLGFGYDEGDGTSFSTPMVSGLAALLLAQNPLRTNEQIRDIIKATARDLPDSGTPNWDGAGRIDVAAALGEQGIYAQVAIASPFPQRLQLWAGIGDPASPLCSVQLLDNSNFFPLTGTSIDASFGVSPCASFWPPTPSNQWFLRIINPFSCTSSDHITNWNLGSGSGPIIAKDTPVAITCGVPNQATSFIDAAGPDLAAAKSANLSAVPALGAISYSVTTRNLGSAQATNVIIRDTLPPGVTLVNVTPPSPTCVNAGPIITCSLGNLAANNGADGGPDESIVTIDVTAPDVTTLSLGLTNYATVDPDGLISEFNEVNNESCADVTVRSADPTLTVNSTSDPGDSVCDTTECTLREAVAEVNARPGGNTILFDIPTSDPGFDGAVFTIDIGGLPLILSDDATEIDGTSQPGFAGTPIVRVAAGAPSGVPSVALRISSSNNTVRGLLVNESPAESELEAGIVVENGQDNQIAGNWFGLNAAGSAAEDNPNISIVLAAAGPGNLIGGTEPGDGNVVSDDIVLVGGGENLVQGNIIGADKTGTVDILSAGGVFLQSTTGNLIGGTEPAARNVISGNAIGVRMAEGAIANTVQGNYIGVDATGTAALPNFREGVEIQPGASSNLIGGPEPGAGNIISGNGTTSPALVSEANIWVAGDDNTIQGNWIGPDANCAIPSGPSLNIVAALVLAGDRNQVIGNVISGNPDTGVKIGEHWFSPGPSGEDNVLKGNIIGMDCSGNTVLGNAQWGVRLVSQSGAPVARNIIGGAGAGEGNVIAGNSLADIELFSSHDNVFIGNIINLDANGSVVISSFSRIDLRAGADHNTFGGKGLGDGNLIGCRGFSSPVNIDGSATVRNSFLGNIYRCERFGPTIFGGLPIDLENGGNTELPAPILNTLVLATGPVTGTACGNCLVEVYSHPGSSASPVLSTSEGRTVADAGGNFSLSGVPAGPKVFATNTDVAGNTSEFSAGIVVPTGCVSDADCDGLDDGSDPCPANPDCDDDDLGDGDEINTHGTDPLDPDTNSDDLSDGAEVNIHGSNPLVPDTDGDSLGLGDPFGLFLRDGVEAFIGTLVTVACSATPATDDEDPDALGPDWDDSQDVDGSDVFLFAQRFGTEPGEPPPLPPKQPYSVRFDIYPTAASLNKIDGSDVFVLAKYFGTSCV